MSAGTRCAAQGHTCGRESCVTGVITREATEGEEELVGFWKKVAEQTGGECHLEVRRKPPGDDQGAEEGGWPGDASGEADGRRARAGCPRTCGPPTEEEREHCTAALVDETRV